MVQRFLAFSYLKYFFVTLLSLILFFVGIDYVQSFKSLPHSANLQILYLFYKSLNAIDILFPITLIFALIMLKNRLIRSNELVALYALGYSKRSVLIPIIVISTLLTTIYLVLHLTSFAYANEYAYNIKKYQSLSSATSNLFFKYDNDYVYFEKLFPLNQKAENIKIYELEKRRLKRIITARSAQFRQNAWHMKNASVVFVGDDKKLHTKIQTLSLLQGYKPKILDSVYEGKSSITLLDAFEALSLLKRQSLNLNKIKAVIYFQLFFPFFAPFLMVIIYYFVPVSARVSNLNLFLFFATIISLVLWGVLYTLAKLAFTGSLSPEIAIILPISLLLVVSLFLYKKF